MFRRKALVEGHVPHQAHFYKQGSKQVSCETSCRLQAVVSIKKPSRPLPCFSAAVQTLRRALGMVGFEAEGRRLPLAPVGPGILDSPSASPSAQARRWRPWPPPPRVGPAGGSAGSGSQRAPPGGRAPNARALFSQTGSLPSEARTPLRGAGSGRIALPGEGARISVSDETPEMTSRLRAFTSDSSKIGSEPKIALAVYLRII